MNKKIPNNVIKANFKKRRKEQNRKFTTTIALLLISSFYVLYKYNASTIVKEYKDNANNASTIAKEYQDDALIELTNIKITDGDSFEATSRKMRLYGIDAPEYKQRCTKNGKYYNCGQTSKQYLQSLLNNNTKCTIRNIDKYNRLVVVCYNDRQDINAEMVKQGHAVAYTRYSTDYVQEEKYARNNNLGMWQGEFMNPEQYRINKR